MFLRRLRAHKDGKEHGYWSLVEAARTADGPRQRTSCYLGELRGWAQAHSEESAQQKLLPCEAGAQAPYAGPRGCVRE